MASLVAVPALISSADDTPPEETSTSTTTTTKKTSKLTTTNKPSLPALYPDADYAIAKLPYAVIKINEVTDETKLMTQDPKEEPLEYAMIKCEVLYAVPPSFYKYQDQPLADITEMYVIETSVEDIKQYDTVFIYVENLRAGANTFYGPITGDDGRAEFLPFVDGKIVVESLDSLSFASLMIVNYGVDDKMDGGNVASDAFPKRKFESGITLEDIIAFFDAYAEAARLYKEVVWPELVGDPNVIY